MSSNNHEQYSDIDSSIDSVVVKSSMNSKFKLCAICGTNTAHIINIDEVKHGPEMINILNGISKQLPRNDEKFVCHKCINIFIGWYTLHTKNDDDNNYEDAEPQQPSSTVSVADTTESTHGQITSKTSGK